MSKHKYLNVAPFQTDIILLHCPPDAILKECKKIVRSDVYPDIEQNLKKFPLNSTTNGRAFLLDGGGSVIWTRKGDRSSIIHEALHALHHMLMQKEITLSEETDEVYAYLGEYVINSLI